MRFYITLFSLSLILFSCNNSEEAEASSGTATTDTVNKKYTLTPFADVVAYDDAKITTCKYNSGQFSFGVEGTKYKLGEQTPDAPQKMCANSAKGQHIHLIVDNAPYAAKYTADFEHKIDDGDHYVLAFLSRSYHESIKSPGASFLQKASIKDNSFTNVQGVKDLMLFYSRPKGNYVGKANTDKVMLDFYLANVDLGKGYTVNASINGESHTVDKWQPYYIEGLPMGQNTIKLTLMKDGKAVDAPLNPVSRTFTLAADPTE